MIDFWNGTNTPDGTVWFNQFTNEYEFEKRPELTIGSSCE